MSTALYQKYIIGDDGPHSDLNRKVWAGTPWIIDVFTGSCGEERDRDIIWWLQENMGTQAWPFGDEPRPGRWYRGGATVFGWTWYGFATEADMKAFEAAWPTPTATERET